MHIFELQLFLSGGETVVYPLFYGLDVLIIVDIKIDLIELEFVAKFKILLCGLCLLAERIDLTLDFRNDVVCRLQVCGGLFKLVFRLVALRTELGYSCRFLKDMASIVRFCGHNLRNSALTDDRIAFFADTGVSKESNDIFHTAAGFVDIVLAESRTVEPSRYDDFVIWKRRKNMLSFVVESERHFAIGHTLTFFCARKDDVLHIFAAELLCTLLAKRPSYCVRNVGFSAPVWTYDRGDTLLERDFNLIRKGFKTSQFDFDKV